MVYRLLVGIGLTVLGYYVGQQVERDTSTRERLRRRREERAQKESVQAVPVEEREAPPSE